MYRRQFLAIGSALLLSGVIASRASFAQEQDKSKGEGNKQDKPEDKKEGDEQDPYKVNHLDSRGTPYRDCPECGGKMYKDDGRTWVCEACGYSYEE